MGMTSTKIDREVSSVNLIEEKSNSDLKESSTRGMMGAPTMTPTTMEPVPDSPFPTGKYFNICSVRGTCISAPLSNNQYLIQQLGSTYVKMMWKFLPSNGAYVVRNRDGLVIDNY